MIQEQKRNAGIPDSDVETDNKGPRIHKRGISEHATFSVAETIATHRRLMSANTEK